MVLKKSLVFVLATAFITGGFFLLIQVLKPEPVPQVTTVADTGTVRQLVSVSGIATAADTAALSFSNTGTVESVFVNEGDEVLAGTVLATLESNSLAADRLAALASVRSAEANLNELRSGITDTSRAVSTETVKLKETQLANIRSTEIIKVNTARSALLTGDLSAYSKDGDERAVAPTISGTYECPNEGTYTLTLFRSGTNSGYSFRVSGLESGTYEASFEQPLTFGTCGLRARFDENSTYSDSVWHIDIPNKKSNTYITRRNAYELAIDEAESSIALAEQELLLAQASALDATAPTRKEVIDRAEAAVFSAQANLARIDVEIAKQTLRAPFSGTIVSVSMLPGETVGTLPVITLLSPERYELKARIPEVDIGKLAVGQRAEVIFDTSSDEIITASIDYLSPEAVTIDGVAYYEARLLLDARPQWLRSGLNADIDIIIAEESNLVRVPKRFVSETAAGTYTVLTKQGLTIATTTIDVAFTGNDGYLSIVGIEPGTELVAP